MLAAMAPTPSSSSPPDAAHVADATHCATPGAAPRPRADACPGALRLHQAEDGALARIRVVGGVLDAAQAEALADAALHLGDGHLHLTSRGNIQLRGLPAESGTRLAQLLAAAGLLPSPAHERVRNIVASPLSGLDAGGHRDVAAWVSGLDRLLCESEAAGELSGRFLFACDDGRGDVLGLDADVTLLATPDGDALLLLGAGGHGDRTAVRVAGTHAPAAALAAAEVFLTVTRERGARVWRIAELPPEGTGTDTAGAVGAGAADRPGTGLATGGAALLRRVAARVEGAACLASVPLRAAARSAPDGGPEPGIVENPGGGGRAALSVLAPLGRLSGEQWRSVARLARREGTGEVRVTPWRGVVVPGVAAGRARGALAALGDAGLVTESGSPWRGVGACTGRPGCGKALADVRADATATAPAGAGHAGGLPVYWSGCARRCGHPRGAHVEVVAEPDGYRVTEVPAAPPAHSPASTGALVPFGARTRLAVAVAAARAGHGPGNSATSPGSSDNATR